MDRPRLILQRFQTFPLVSWVEGVFDRTVPFTQQPDQVAVGLYGPLAHQGLATDSSLALENEDHDFAVALPERRGDAWEALGSDGYSGIAWFGPANAVESVIDQIRAKLFERLTTLTVLPVDDDHFAIPHWRSWLFEDGTRLLLVYVDVGYQDFGLETVTAEGVAQALFGAHTDDRLLHEFLGMVARPLLNRAGFPMPAAGHDDDEDDGEEDETLDDALEAFSVGGHEAQASDTALLLNFTRRVFVDLMGWDQALEDRDEGEDDEGLDDPNNRALARMALRWHEQGGVNPVLTRLVSPTGQKLAVDLVEIPNLDRYRAMRFYRALVWLDGGMFVVRVSHVQEDGQLRPVRESLPASLEDATVNYEQSVQRYLDQGCSKQP